MSELTGETIRRDEHGEPTEVVQYAILDGGKHYIYGDQNWVAYGGAIRDGSHPDGRVQQRAVTVTYGPWVDGGPETVALPAKAPTVEATARTVTRDWMTHLGYTPEQIAEGEPEPDHSLCEHRGEYGWFCLDENEQDRHPIHREMGEVAEMVMFVLEHPALARGGTS